MSAERQSSQHRKVALSKLGKGSFNAREGGPFEALLPLYEILSTCLAVGRLKARMTVVKSEGPLMKTRLGSLNAKGPLKAIMGPRRSD